VNRPQGEEIGGEPPPGIGRGAWIERALLTAGLVALFAAGYFCVGKAVDPARARELATGLDARLPFVPATIWVYAWVFPAAFAPLFVVRSRDLFRRVVLAYAIVMVISFLAFALFPVTSSRLRADVGGLDRTRFSQWAVALLYRIDPPLNLFPSLHLSIAALAALACWKADRRTGGPMGAGVALVGLSICTVKQHFVLDGIGGLALAALVWGVTFRKRPPAPEEPFVPPGRGTAMYVVFLAACYGALYVAFRVAS
jgi:membrane-associated phospholipid phosphatase